MKLILFKTSNFFCILRATFEDKILMSDIVFVKTWFTVAIPKFYSTVTNLLSEPLEMRTVAQIKKDRRIRVEPNPDQLYTDIVRKPKVFSELKIPRNLQKNLPYNLKPKFHSQGRNVDSERVTIELDSKEKKIRNLQKMMTAVAKAKEDKLNAEKSRRIQELINRQKVLEDKKFRRQKEARKQVSRALSKERIRKERLASRGNKRKRKD